MGLGVLLGFNGKRSGRVAPPQADSRTIVLVLDTVQSVMELGDLADDGVWPRKWVNKHCRCGWAAVMIEIDVVGVPCPGLWLRIDRVPKVPWTIETVMTKCIGSFGVHVVAVWARTRSRHVLCGCAVRGVLDEDG